MKEKEKLLDFNTPLKFIFSHSALKDGAERLYFVVETKSGLFADDLRDREHAKVQCGEAHFKALETGPNPAKFVKATRLEDLFA